MNRVWNLGGRGLRRLGGERAASLLLWVAVTVPVFLLSEQPYEPGLPLLWVQIAAVPLLAAAVGVGRRHPLPAAAVPPALGLAASSELYTGNFMIAQILLAFLLGRRATGMRAGLLFCTAVCLAGLALDVFTVDDPWDSWVNVVGNVLLTILLPWLAGRYARRHAQLMRTGWELAERLEQEQALTGERMRLLERSRIAGDMHDSLGHDLSLIAIRAATLEVATDLDEVSRRESAAELRRSAADATERLREIIGVLREDGESAPVLPADEAVSALVERAAGSGMAVTVRGSLQQLPPMADRAAHRVVQEALTNAAKHAPGAAVTVQLDTDSGAGEAQITVANTAPDRPSPGKASGGYGLISLDERVRLAGGRMHAHHVDGGFTVSACLPLTAGAAAAPPGPQQTLASERELAAARRKVRRSVIDAISIPVAATSVLLLLMFGFDLDDGDPPLLDANVYQEMRIGQNQSSVESRLPPDQSGDDRPKGVPADPSRAEECHFYRTTAGSPSLVYRLCFADGRLIRKDQVEMAQQ